MPLKARIKKLERRQDLANGLGIIFMQDGETKEEAYRRTYPEGRRKPKTVFYMDSNLCKL